MPKDGKGRDLKVGDHVVCPSAMFGPNIECRVNDIAPMLTGNAGQPPMNRMELVVILQLVVPIHAPQIKEMFRVSEGEPSDDKPIRSTLEVVKN